MMAFALVNYKTNLAINVSSPYFRIIGSTIEYSTVLNYTTRFYPMHPCTEEEFSLLMEPDTEEVKK